VSNVAQPLVQASLLGEAIDPGPAIVLVADEDMNYVAVNGYACEVLGYTRAQLLGLKVTDVASSRDAAARFAAFRDAGHDAGRARLKRKDGKRIEVDYRARPTTVAGMVLYVFVGWPASASPPPAKRARRSARARV
jgi:PAS domain S-box-containing protein